MLELCRINHFFRFDKDEKGGSWDGKKKVPTFFFVNKIIYLIYDSPTNFHFNSLAKHLRQFYTVLL